ncbi:PaaI family thioesterase [Bradyrhizobium sediminis]|uniref:PaaI family thioesterase n=1 Tax=Bradyrhizobium sediminis TaxID=2840469 RepID=A0A975RWX0_9BRAD|nr:PaaI family thioesterase [Bradyrhizobium sediminis]QWG22396.1 PaaI family thioesterase [Bradyrhizobium sediminis]
MIATALDRLTAPPSSKLLGWHLLDARPSEGWVRIGFDGKKEFCNPAGFVQGGILSAMLDDTMGPAVFIMTEGRLYTTTITMTVNFLAPAKPGPIVGEASVTQLGKTVAFVEGRLMAGDGTVLATSTASARLVETAKAIRREHLEVAAGGIV